MNIDSGLFAVAGIGLLFMVLLAFATFRQVNRFIVVLLSLSILLLAIAMTQAVYEMFVAGEAGWPGRGRIPGRVRRDTLPIAFWAATLLGWAGVAATWLFAGYLFRIATMRRRAGRRRTWPTKPGST